MRLWYKQVIRLKNEILNIKVNEKTNIVCEQAKR